MLQEGGGRADPAAQPWQPKLHCHGCADISGLPRAPWVCVVLKSKWTVMGTGLDTNSSRVATCDQPLCLSLPFPVPVEFHRWGTWADTEWPHCVPRLTLLHQLLQPMASCARVAQCAEAVPTLLQAFFSAVTQVSPLPRFPIPVGPA